MTSKQKTVDLTVEVAPVREPYSAPSYELFRFETDGLVQVSGGNISGDDKDDPTTGKQDWGV